jgi:hypothetical protein
VIHRLILIFCTDANFRQEFCSSECQKFRRASPKLDYDLPLYADEINIILASGRRFVLGLVHLIGDYSGLLRFSLLK